MAKECPAFKYKWVRFSANLSAHNDDDDGYVDGDDDDDYDDDDDDDEDGQSQAGPFLGQFVRPRLRAVSVAAEMTEVSTFLASCLPLLSAKNKKTSCQKKQKLCPHHKISCVLATFVSIKICSYALNLFSVQIPNNLKSTFNPTI